MKKWLNKIRSNSKGIIYVLFVYIIAQFLWWEVLLVKQNNALILEKQKVLELTLSDTQQLKAEIDKLQKSKVQKTYMVVGEGTIFLLLLLYGINLIRKANKKEHELLDQKNNFLLSITHELKTPLTTTKLQLQTLKKHQLSQEKQLELIDIAISENERLNNLIDNVLLATRMQADEYKMVKELTNVSETIGKIANASYKNALENGTLKLDIGSDINLEIDRLALPSIVINLIDNAFKYSGESIAVEVILKKEERSTVLRISDEGMGIKDAEKTRIFDQFYRSGNEETRKAKGTGLGLFIVKYLVEENDGTIAVKDNVPTGSIFEINFANG